MHSWGGERKPSSMDINLSDLSSLFDRQVTEPIVRPSTPPPLPGDELMYHGMFHCLSEMSLLRYFVRPNWRRHVAFPPKNSGNFGNRTTSWSRYSCICDSEVADRREGLVLIDENPLTHPIPITTPSERLRPVRNREEE